MREGREGRGGQKGEAVKILEEACNEGMGATEREAVAYMVQSGGGEMVVSMVEVSKSLLAGKIRGMMFPCFRELGRKPGYYDETQSR